MPGMAMMVVAGFGRRGDAGADQGEDKGRQGRAGRKAAVNVTLEHTNQSRFSIRWGSRRA
jgi:hypothetical protein